MKGKKKKILSSLFIFLLFLILYLYFGMNIINYKQVLNIGDILFEADVPRVIEEITNAEGDHSRTTVHPLFVLFLNPAGTLLADFLENSHIAAVILTSIAGATSIVLFYYFIITFINLPNFEALIVTTIFGLTSSQLFFSSIPETFVYGTLTLLIIYIISFKAIEGLKTNYYLLPFAGILTLGITITNFLQALVLYFSVTVDWHKHKKQAVFGIKQPIRYLILTICLTVSLSIGLSFLQKSLYPSSQEFYKTSQLKEINYIKIGQYSAKELVYELVSLRIIGEFTILDFLNSNFNDSELTQKLNEKVEKYNSLSSNNGFEPVKIFSVGYTFKALWLNLGSYSIVAPSPNIEDYGDFEIFTFNKTFYDYAFIYYIAITIFYIVVMYGTYIGYRSSPLLITSILSGIAINLFIHFFYGTHESFLYSPHITFLILILFTYGLKGIKNLNSKFHWLSTAIILTILITEIYYNFTFMKEILKSLSIYY